MNFSDPSLYLQQVQHDLGAAQLTTMRQAADFAGKMGLQREPTGN